VSEPITCDLCGTVNVVAAKKCMACGQGFVPPEPPPPPPEPEPDPEPAKKKKKPKKSKRKSRAKAEPSDAGDRDRGTDHVDSPRTDSTGEHGHGDTDTQHGRRKRKRRPESSTAGDDSVRYVVRLLLPEGERRSFEVGRKQVTLGSGLDEVGLTGDPRVLEAEAEVYVRDGRLYVEPADDSTNVYVRMRDEERLSDGDVVLMGDVAATFAPLDPVPVAEGANHALGGSSAVACGRLRFLRRDGSPGPAHDLPAGKTVVGRTDGHLNFPHDTRLSRRHVRFFASEDGVTVEDLDSRNGTYMRVRRRVALSVGDSLRVGSAGLQIRDRIGNDD